MLTGFTFCIPLKSKKAEDVINAYINHICCPFGSSKKILTDNGTEFKNKLWTDVFEKLKTEQKFTPIYSPQCNGTVEGFNKFLKATIATQLETCIEWDDLVWKATAAYNFFPTESSGIAPFFLMFGREAAVKHNLLESENPKYLGTENNMINTELLSKLYLVVAHNLNEARKARDGNNRKKMTKNPDQLKIGDNVLVRDHTSKAFQPKYKDFCITGLLGKNQVKIKDNHGHTTKVHHKDVKKIPMTEKVCQLYEEEQVGKVRNGRKALPDSKMPDLGWDITEQLETQEITQTDTSIPLFPESVITIIILLITFLINTKTNIQEISKEISQAIMNMTRKISGSRLFKRASERYRKMVQAVSTATRPTTHNSHSKTHRKGNSNTQGRTSMRKLHDQYDTSHIPYSSNTPSNSPNQ